MDWLSSFILAVADEKPGGNFWFNMIPMGLILLAAYFMLLRPEKRKQDELQKLQQVKEKDHVITTGGIYGVVTNIQREAGRLTLRIDESNGTKIKISLAAVAKILGDDDSDVKDKS